MTVLDWKDIAQYSGITLSQHSSEGIPSVQHNSLRIAGKVRSSDRNGKETRWKCQKEVET